MLLIRACVYVNSSLQASSNQDTTINEGHTLDLDCDASNSIPHASVEWLSPEGINVSNERILEIMNIQRSAAGIYTCVATYPISGATMNSTVNVTVQCECHDACTYKIIIYIHKKVICVWRGN